MSTVDHGPYVDAAAATLHLRLSPQYRPGVLQFFALAASMAELVQGLPLAPADESGNIFAPVPPNVEHGA